MTCIVGLVKNNKVFIGGDSAGVSGYNIQIRNDSKVFRNGPFLMGFTTSFRMGQILRYDFIPPDHLKNEDDMKYMVSTFIPAIKKSFKDGGFSKIKDSEDIGGNFLVGYKNSIYEIESDYQVAIISSNIASVGCGSDIALGAMYALNSLPPKKRILKSLEITAHLNAGVRPPFIIQEI